MDHLRELFIALAKVEDFELITHLFRPPTLHSFLHAYAAMAIVLYIYYAFYVHMLSIIFTLC